MTMRNTDIRKKFINMLMVSVAKRPIEHFEALRFEEENELFILV
jgi:hypothetical protein